MSQPVLVGDIIRGILNNLRAHDMDAVFEQEWTDVTDALRIPSIRNIQLEIRIGEGDIVPHRLNGRTYCRKSDLEYYFGTSDFSVKIRRRND